MLKGGNLLLEGANSFLLEQTHFHKGDNNVLKGFSAIKKHLVSLKKVNI